MKLVISFVCLVLAAICLMVALSGCSSKVASVPVASNDSLCAAIGLHKATGNSEQLEKVKNTIKERIRAGSFDLKTSDCESIALSSIGAYKLLEADSVLI